MANKRELMKNKYNHNSQSISVFNSGNPKITLTC